MNDIRYRENISTPGNIIAHLKSCDADFYSELSSRVNIEEYAAKLAAKAFRYEAWNGENLVGLLAVYYNGTDGFDFISNVSVCGDFGGRRIASTLVEACVARAGRDIRLQVVKDNVRALSLYRKFGFSVFSEDKNIQILVLRK